MKNKFRIENSDQRNGLIELISHLPDNLTIIEVGSAYGESAECFLSTGKVDKIYCIDPWRDDREQYFDQRHANDKRVIKMKMTGDEAVDSFEDNSVDFCYIDCIHEYQNLKQDILNYLPKIKKGGWIGGHDYNDTFKGVIKAVDERFGKPDFTFKDSSWLIKVMKLNFKDKNGKDIYKGDIFAKEVLCDGEYIKIYGKIDIKENGEYTIEGRKKEVSHLVPLSENEVVGNIFEDGDLTYINAL